MQEEHVKRRFDATAPALCCFFRCAWSSAKSRNMTTIRFTSVTEPSRRAFLATVTSVRRSLWNASVTRRAHDLPRPFAAKL